MVVKRSRVKEICGQMQITSEFLDALDTQVEDIIKRSCKRASENSRRTVMERDL